MESFTLYQVNEYIRRVIALNFKEPIWVEAEISQCNESRGNYYIDLIDKDEQSDQVTANAQANLWQSSFKFIKRKIGPVIHELLQEGRTVRFKCKVDFHERYGLKLVVEDIDPNYTFGRIELKRQEIINRLQEEGFYTLNKETTLPDVIQRVALITSSRAAGYKDFKAHLEANAYGYQYTIDIYESGMQGQHVERDCLSAIELILSKPDHTYDAVVVIRGGGSKLDLSAFDNFNIAVAIAKSQIPFIIGIGHEIDQSVVDLVSKVSVKTPTAVADLLIEKMLHYESQILHKYQYIAAQANQYLQAELNTLELVSQGLLHRIHQIINRENQSLNIATLFIKNGVGKVISQAQNSLDLISAKVDGLNPSKILKRGFAHIKVNGKTVYRAKDLKKGQEIDILFADSNKTAKVI